ncbi:MAG: adenylate cyclase [Leptolyngbya sp.]|nr:MAG: adenylate cyclase [Leptolyngbya sp.]
MPTEIERKFLVKNDDWRSLGTGVFYCQGYLVRSPSKTVRVRIAGEQAYLTIKGATAGIARAEYEYAIPVDQAQELLQTLCEPALIQKTRYRVELGELVWEIDEFGGENQGLIVAEVELADEKQAIALPDWIGAEVSHDPRYYNTNLSKFPYCRWAEKTAASRSTNAK